jgi:hypothetical protein
MGEKEFFIPYLRFQLKNGNKIWVDAYFPAKLSNPFRIAGLIRSRVDSPSAHENKLDENKLDGMSHSEILNFAFKALGNAKVELETVKRDRGLSYGRWSFLRLLFVPLGLRKKIVEDETRAKLQNELSQAIDILKILIEGKPDYGKGFVRLKLVDGVPVDAVYKELYKIDSGFRESVEELWSGSKSISKASRQPDDFSQFL